MLYHYKCVINILFTTRKYIYIQFYRNNFVLIINVQYNHTRISNEICILQIYIYIYIYIYICIIRKGNFIDFI